MDLNMKMDMGQIKEKLLAVSDKKTLIKFGIGLGSIILFLISLSMWILSKKSLQKNFNEETLS